MNDDTAFLGKPRRAPSSHRARALFTDDTGKHEVDLGPHTSIGRDSVNSIQISDRNVSKKHCLIHFDPNRGYLIRDLGSTNGTFINGLMLRGELPLRDGDVISIGATRMTFLSEKKEAERFTMEVGEEVVWLKQIRSLEPHEQERFLPEREIANEADLRADYEKLRLTHELQKAIGIELNLDRIFHSILDHTFKSLDCDRAVILMEDDNGEFKPRAIKTRKQGETVRISSTLISMVQTEKVGFITADALTDERLDSAESILVQQVRSSMAVPILFEDQLLGVMVIDSSISVDAYSEKDLSLLTNIANQTAQFIKNREMAEKIETDAVTRERFQRLLSPDLAELVVSGRLKVEKGGETRCSTVLFADIRGFTAISEPMSASSVLQMLNEFFELMVEIVFRHEGTVDKFVGDMIMVLWGAPIAHDDDPVRAVQAAIDMQKALKRLNETRRLEGQPPLEIGIGVNTGEIVAGYIGSTRTMSYSVIGNAVNVASRLCSAAQAGQILISEETYRRVGGRFRAEELSPLRAKGISLPLKVFSIQSP